MLFTNEQDKMASWQHHPEPANLGYANRDVDMLRKKSTTNRMSYRGDEVKSLVSLCILALDS